MQQKATAPIIAIAVVVLIGLCALLYKQFAAPPASAVSKPPDWIDPATNRPKAQMKGSSQGPGAGGMRTGQPPMGVPGGGMMPGVGGGGAPASGGTPAPSGATGGQ